MIGFWGNLGNLCIQIEIYFSYYYFYFIFFTYLSSVSFCTREQCNPESNSVAIKTRHVVFFICFISYFCGIQEWHNYKDDYRIIGLLSWMLCVLILSNVYFLLLQTHSRTVNEKCISFVEGTRCTNPCLPMARHCVSRILCYVSA